MRPRHQLPFEIPRELLAEGSDLFLPSPEVRDWIVAEFIREGGFHNPYHAHLTEARIGVLWSRLPTRQRGNLVVATAEKMRIPSGLSGWHRQRWLAQLAGWFPDHEELDFLLTFHAGTAAAAALRSWLRIVEHELCHCGQALDEFKQLRFSKTTGRPIFELKGHDVETFFEENRRWGAGPEVARLLEVARRSPAISDAALQAGLSCGTCLRLAS